jgi:hypothetical protein
MPGARLLVGSRLSARSFAARSAPALPELNVLNVS